MKVKIASEYRINKKGAECFRTDSLESAAARFEELSQRRPGVYTMQTRRCQLDRFGVRLKDAAGKSLWSSWQEVRS